MGQRTLVPDAGEVVLHEVKAVGRTGLVMILRSAGEEVRCPACARSSRRVHSRYSRQLSDLPWEGIPVRIELRVRRFFCGAGQCGRRVFTERLPNTVKRYGRRTCRLSAALEQITMALGGSAGSRLAEQLGILASGSMLLRCLRKKARVDGAVPADLDIHLVLDNYGTHKTALVRQWLQRRPRYHLHFTPTHASWLNQVERWFALLTHRQIKRGSHRSVQELEAAIKQFIAAHNQQPKPFRWTKTADQILASIARFATATLDAHSTKISTRNQSLRRLEPIS